ncbi:MAG: type II toxin-antitoxin system RelE/ParE family toxin [Desulfosarcina sp.]|nr:type II toxin-antitoxin system RelE/ParE family toxin [Desulfosarcina sp.]MBC2741826.1 type II toxin-antitoxin system RelE/ParE family toxin [Desulfosarcina sp.]MBC2764739.1 type II toxin-antitoxin system RelE/ParE family toxin [Desulfosarcina sp.]
MIRPYQIRYLPAAEDDLDDIFGYILKDNPTAAAGLLDTFDRTISQLALNPELGVVPKDERLKRLGYRMLIVGKYLVFYVVKSGVVQIRRVIHGARRYDFLL